MLSTSSFLIRIAAAAVAAILLFSAQATIASNQDSGGTSDSPLAHTAESNLRRFDHALNSIANDFGPMRELYAPDAQLKFCWGGDKPDCMHGTVDDVLLSFYEALESFQTKIRSITGAASPDIMSVRWANYMETKLGCGEMTTGMATVEFEHGKVVRHLALFDDALHCIPAYHEAMAKATGNDSA